MKLVPAFAVVSVLLVALAACASGNASTPEPSTAAVATTPSATPSAEATIETECPPTPIDVTITYELVADSSGGVTINAATNLPDGSEMMGSFFVLNGYFGQDVGVVEGGKISFGPFSDKGTALHGDYDMSITLPIARNQPESVQACIGSTGENLTGPLVSAEKITGDNVASVDVLVTVK